MGLLILVLVVLAFIPSAIASNKGRSPVGFFLFGLLLFVPALIVVLLIPARPTSASAMWERHRNPRLGP